VNHRAGEVSHTYAPKSRNDLSTCYPLELFSSGRLIVRLQVLSNITLDKLRNSEFFSFCGPFARRIVALCHPCKLDACFSPRLLWRQYAMASNYHLAKRRRTPSTPAIPNEIAFGSRRLNAQAEAPQLVVPQDVP
jgi:hypothetical protein